MPDTCSPCEGAWKCFIAGTSPSGCVGGIGMWCRYTFALVCVRASVITVRCLSWCFIIIVFIFFVWACICFCRMMGMYQSQSVNTCRWALLRDCPEYGALVASRVVVLRHWNWLLDCSFGLQTNIGVGYLRRPGVCQGCLLGNRSTGP